MSATLAPMNGRGRMHGIATLSGSPAPDSRTWALTAEVGRRLVARGLDVYPIDLRALPPEDLLHGRAETGLVHAALETVARARGVVLVTPIHHAACSGLLKVFLDQLPQAGLAGKVVLPLAVAGAEAHFMVLDYALRPILACLGALHVTPSHCVLSTQIERCPDGPARFAIEAQSRLEAAIGAFASSLAAHAESASAYSPAVMV